jgi:hypothetical protein
MIAIRIDPQLHEASAASQSLCDGWSTVALQSPQDGSIAVSLCGITFLVTSLTQLLDIIRMMSFDLHLAVPPISLRACHRSKPGATPF